MKKSRQRRERPVVVTVKAPFVLRAWVLLRRALLLFAGLALLGCGSALPRIPEACGIFVVRVGDAPAKVTVCVEPQPAANPTAPVPPAPPK